MEKTNTVKGNISLIDSKREKARVLEILKDASLKVLWDNILDLQVHLYAEKERAYIEKFMPWWTSAHKILDIGSGNGSHIETLARHYPGKSFCGFECNPGYVKTASDRHNLENLVFRQNDVQHYDDTFSGSFDVVFLHLVLQHLKDAKTAYHNIHHYLKPGGRLIVIESLDDYRRSSINDSYLDALLNKINNSQHDVKIDRRASRTLMTDILTPDSELSTLFEIEETNITPEGKAVENKQFMFSSNTEKELLFSQKLIFFQIWKKQYGLGVDQRKIYDIYHSLVMDEKAFWCDGWHVLALKKR